MKERIRQPFCWKQQLLVILLLLLLLPSQLVVANPPPPPSASSNHHHHHHHQQQQVSPDDSSTASNTDVLQVVETEYYNAQEGVWVGALPSRWSDTQGKPSISPADTSPPSNSNFEGDWKIVLGGNQRDNYGWEYSDFTSATSDASIQQQQQQQLIPTKRQRIWLRTIVYEPTSPLDATKPSLSSSPDSTTTVTTGRSTRQLSSPTKTTSSRMRARVRRPFQVPPSLPKPSLPKVPSLPSLIPSPLSTLQQARALTQQLVTSIVDDWNFKGFGFSFYKSFLFRESFGMAFRIPLTGHFDVWDRHPHWPSASLSFGLYHPLQVTFGVSLSLNMQWIQWMCLQSFVTLQHVVLYTLLTLARVLILLGSALAYPITLQPILIPASLRERQPLRQKLQQHQLHFRTTYQERIGFSQSWRWSLLKGYYTRRQVWHLYLPTLLSVMEHVNWIQQTMFGTSVASSTTTTAPGGILSSSRRYVQAFLPTWLLPTTRDTSRIASESPLAASKKKPIKASKKKQSATKSNLKPESMLLSPDNHFVVRDWLQRKTGSLGVSTGYPIPDPPHFSCSAVLSLSGFYFRNRLSSAAASTAAQLENDLFEDDDDEPIDTATTTAAAPDVAVEESSIEESESDSEALAVAPKKVTTSATTT